MEVEVDRVARLLWEARSRHDGLEYDWSKLASPIQDSYRAMARAVIGDAAKSKGRARR